MENNKADTEQGKDILKTPEYFAFKYHCHCSEDDLEMYLHFDDAVKAIKEYASQPVPPLIKDNKGEPPL